MVAVGIGSSFEEDRRLSPTVTGWSRSGLGLPLGKTKKGPRPRPRPRPRPSQGPTRVFFFFAFLEVKKAQSDRDHPVPVGVGLGLLVLREGRGEDNPDCNHPVAVGVVSSLLGREEGPVRPRPDLHSCGVTQAEALVQILYPLRLVGSPWPPTLIGSWGFVAGRSRRLFRAGRNRLPVPRRISSFQV